MDIIQQKSLKNTQCEYFSNSVAVNYLILIEFTLQVAILKNQLVHCTMLTSAFPANLS